MKKYLINLTFWLFIFFLFIGSLLFFFTIWVTGFFSGDISFDQLLFYLNVPMKGASSEIMKDGLVKSFLPPFILVTIALLGIFKVSKTQEKIMLEFKFKSFSGSLRLWPIIIHKKSFWIVLSIILFFASIFKLHASYDLIRFTHSITEVSTFIDEHYVAPSSVKLQFPENKRNLIFIYLESLESSFSDIATGGLSEDNYIPNLSKLALENIHFSDTDRLGGAKQITGTGWTIASMFAQSTGINLRVPFQGNEMNRYGIFFPGAECLGDILAEKGYSNVLMIGSDAVFGGRELFYTTHGDYEIHDYHWAIEEGLIPEDYYVWWGFEDAKLIEFAKLELTNLAAKEEPFNFTLLTVDTHHQEGYVSEEDYEEIYDSQYANVIATSDRQIASFLHWIQEQDFYENTTVIITGDHLTMDTGFNDRLGSPDNRRIFNAFINMPNQSNKVFSNREFSLIDMFPTTLAALGVSIPGNSLGLGVNLFSSKPTLLELYGQEVVDRELNKKSELYDKLFSTHYADL